MEHELQLLVVVHTFRQRGTIHKGKGRIDEENRREREKDEYTQSAFIP